MVQRCDCISEPVEAFWTITTDSLWLYVANATKDRCVGSIFGNQLHFLLMWGFWPWVSEIDWYGTDTLDFSDVCETLADISSYLLAPTPEAKLNDDDVRTEYILISCIQKRVTWIGTTTTKEDHPSPAW